MVKIDGSSFPHQYRRTNPFPIDSTETWKSLKDATEYARNTDAEPYMPYAGQVLSIEGEENIYVLVEDKTISKSDGREHFKLHKISTKEEAEEIYLSKLVEDTAQKLIHFLEGIDVKGEAKVEVLKVLKTALFSDAATFAKSLSSSDFVSGNPAGKGWSLYWKEFVNSTGVKELRTILEIDELDIRKRMRVYEMIVSQLLGENGTRLTTDMIEVLRIDKTNQRIYIDTQDGKLYNPFQKGDYIMVQQFGGENFATSKEYEFVVSSVSADYLTYTNFVGSENDVKEGDTLVRVDSTTNVNRKGIIKHTSVEENGPYIDIIYGMKTDPSNATRTRVGNLSGIITPYWGQLKGYGIYCDNGYFRGDFMLRSGEDVLTKFQVTDANIRAEINSVRYDITEKDNYLRNASFVYDMTYWEHSTTVNVYSASGEMINVNANLYSEKSNIADIVLYKDQYMLRIKNSGITQLNKNLNRKPTKAEKFYVSIQYVCKTSGTIKVGFSGSDLYVEEFLSTNSEFATKSWSGNWDGQGDFLLEFSGDIYIKTLALTTDSLESFKKEMDTVINAVNGRIDAYVAKTDKLEQTTTQLGLSINGLTEELNLYYKKTDAQNYIKSELGIAINGVNSTLESYYRKSDVDSLFVNVGTRINGIEESMTLYASKTDALERNYTDVGTRLSAAEATLTNYAEFKSATENSFTLVNQQLNALEGSLETTVKDMIAGEVSGAAQDLAAKLYASSEDILSRIKGYSQDNRITQEEKKDISAIYESIKSEISDSAIDTAVPVISEADSSIISQVLAFLDEGINTGEAIKTNLRTAINTLKTKYANLKIALFTTKYTLEENASITYPLLSESALKKTSLLDDDNQIYPIFKEYVTARNELADMGVEASREWIIKNQTVISQTSTSIGLLVKKTEAGEVIDAASIIAAINENGDSEIRLKADKITLEGYVSVGEGFRVENGELIANKGRIGGLKIQGDSLTNEGFNNDAYIILRNDNTRTFAGIGGNLIPTSSGGISAVARFENNRIVNEGPNSASNIAIVAEASGSQGNNIALMVNSGDVDIPGVIMGARIAIVNNEIVFEYIYGILKSELKVSYNNGSFLIEYRMGHTNYIVLANVYEDTDAMVAIHSITSRSFRATVFSSAGNRRHTNGFQFCIIGKNR